MDLDKGNKARAGNRNEWVEPMVTEINVAETAANPTTGPQPNAGCFRNQNGAIYT